MSTYGVRYDIDLETFDDLSVRIYEFCNFIGQFKLKIVLPANG